MSDIFDDFEPDDSEEPGQEYPGFPFDLDDRPDNPYIQEIFDQSQWSTWGDFAADKWIDANDANNSEYLRSDFAGELEDLIARFYEAGILDFTDFYTDDDGYYHPYVAYEEG